MIKNSNNRTIIGAIFGVEAAAVSHRDTGLTSYNYNRAHADSVANNTDVHSLAFSSQVYYNRPIPKAIG